MGTYYLGLDIFEECQKDTDLYDIVENTSCFNHLVMSGKLKSHEQISSSLKNLSDCLKTARTLSEGNNKIFNIYKKFITEKGLKIKPELLTNLANNLNNLPLNKLRALNANSSVKEFHEGMKQMHDNIETICTSKDVGRFIAGEEDRVLFSELIDSLLLNKLSQKEKASLMEAFSSVNASKANLVYQYFDSISEDNPPFYDGAGRFPTFLARGEAKRICDNMSDMASILGEQLDTTPPNIGTYFIKDGSSASEVNKLVSEISDQSLEKAKNMVNDYLDKHVSGSDTKFIRDIMYNKRLFCIFCGGRPELHE